MKNLLIVFAAGCFGGLVSSLVMWLFGSYGITAQHGVAIAPPLSPYWLYPRVVWGGLWGFLFLLPMLRTQPFLQGSVLSIFPTVAQLFVVYPFLAHKGIAGLQLGLLTPLFILFFNWVWGVATAYMIRYAR